MLAAELRSIIDAAPAVEGRVLVEQLLGIFAHVERLGAGMDQRGHTGEPRRFSNVDGSDQVHWKARETLLMFTSPTEASEPRTGRAW
jgi:hypothetical protein